MRNITQTPIIGTNNTMTLSAPTTVHVELTSGCPLSCRHCYNYWRQEDNSPVHALTREKLDFILDEIISNKVMHVIFTGGEPLLAYDNLVAGIERLKAATISVSCNSNLYSVTSKRMRQLRKSGLEHILTSLNSYDRDVNDDMVSKVGAFDQIVKGIRTTVDAGIRISVNMIITHKNLSHIYKTAEFAASLGAKKFFATRTVPNVSRSLESQKEFLIERKEAKIIAQALLKVKNKLGLVVGGLVPFPLCFYDDLEKYGSFYNHGCPAGNKMVSINADGNIHACVHESKSYGSIFEIGLKGAWENMRLLWQKGDVFPQDCKSCKLFERCNAGCRVVAEAFYGNINAPDNLKRGMRRKKISRLSPKSLIKETFADKRFKVAAGLRFRKEAGFYVISGFAADILCIAMPLAEKILSYNENKKMFTLNDIGQKYEEDLHELIDKHIIEAVH